MPYRRRLLDLLYIVKHWCIECYLSESEVISTVDGRPGHQSVVITGRGGGAALQDLADTVSEVKDIKHAFNAGVKARKGVDY